MPFQHLPRRPQRIYEPNIIHNPLSWMGIWTPHGWRVHEKRWGRAETKTVCISGDGRTTFFPEVLQDPSTHRVEWSDDLHQPDDPFTDGGIYPCDPRVEYPEGRARWAVSHTVLCYPVADHTLYTHEYTWDLTHGHLQTHFRRHVRLEQARTDDRDGNTVTVSHRPLSATIEGNVQYPLPNSAVRGVWDNPEKRGTNYYTRRVIELLRMHNGVYCMPSHIPVVQCYGLYPVAEDDAAEQAFDRDTGSCIDTDYLQERLFIALDEPKIGMLRFPFREVESRVYQSPISMPAASTGVVNDAHLQELTDRLGATFSAGQVGYARDHRFDGFQGAAGYSPAYDLNNDGVIDEIDLNVARHHLGREVRFNLYRDGYFGGDWLSTSVCLEPEHRPGVTIIADYDHGGGYDAQAGVIRLLESPGPGVPVWVEYHYDAPAEAGHGNMKVYIYREIER